MVHRIILQPRNNSFAFGWKPTLSGPVESVQLYFRLFGAQVASPDRLMAAPRQGMSQTDICCASISCWPKVLPDFTRMDGAEIHGTGAVFLLDAKILQCDISTPFPKNAS